MDSSASLRFLTTARISDAVVSLAALAQRETTARTVTPIAASNPSASAKAHSAAPETGEPTHAPPVEKTPIDVLVASSTRWFDAAGADGSVPSEVARNSPKFSPLPEAPPNPAVADEPQGQVQATFAFISAREAASSPATAAPRRVGPETARATGAAAATYAWAPGASLPKTDYSAADAAASLGPPEATRLNGRAEPIPSTLAKPVYAEAGKPSRTTPARPESGGVDAVFLQKIAGYSWTLSPDGKTLILSQDQLRPRPQRQVAQIMLQHVENVRYWNGAPLSPASENAAQDGAPPAAASETAPAPPPPLAAMETNAPALRFQGADASA